VHASREGRLTRAIESRALRVTPISRRAFRSMLERHTRADQPRGDGEVMELTARDAAQRIAATYPEMAGLDVVVLGAGTDHVAFDVGGRFVFRFPYDSNAAATLSHEARLTAWLAPQLPLPVPVYRWIAQGDVPFAGYERLPGTPALLADTTPVADDPGAVDTDLLGRCLGRFLRTLHRCDAAVAAALGVPADDDPARDEWSAVAIADVALAVAEGHLPARTASTWTGHLAVTPPPFAGAARVVHADFAAEHVLLDDDGVASGVIDWSDAVLGDPAIDLAGLFHWTDAALLDAALAEYAPDDEVVLTRACWLAACRAAADIAYGVTAARPEYIRAGRRALMFLWQWIEQAHGS
jgi:aminoglycoside phosphotransferase (APT) family kinase protein